MYQNEYGKLSDQLAKSNSRPNRNREQQGAVSADMKWPSLQEASPFLGDSQAVRLVYQELYYRHIFSKFPEKNLVAQDRQESFANYQLIFDQLMKDMSQLHAPQSGLDERRSLLKSLPVSYIWDLLDEYLFQAQNFSQFKAKTVAKKAKSVGSEGAELEAAVEADFNLLKENPQLYHSQEVFQLLQKLISYSGVDAYLKAVREDKEKPATNTEDGTEQAKFIGRKMRHDSHTSTFTK